MNIIGHLPCHIQIRLNKRRRKRKGKKEKEPALKLYDRVYSVLETSRLIDYTHPREVDPFWNKLYLQYEYLTYLIIAVKKEIEKEKEKSYPDFKYIDELGQDIKVLEQKRKKILDFMYNFMIIIYGAVLKNRFYGWRKYTEEFISLFTEQALDSITRLNFDPDKSRPSIYFYQVFWLSGIGLTKKIQNLSNKNINDEYSDTNRGSKLFSTYDNFDEENQEYYDRAIQALIDNQVIDNPQKEELQQETEQKIEVQEIVADPEKIEIKEVETEISEKIYFDNNNDNELIDEQNNENEDDMSFTDIVYYLLKQANINPDIIYSNTNDNKMFNDIGKFIKKLLKKGKIKLTDKQKEKLKLKYKEV